MKLKGILFTGIILLVAGIILKKSTQLDILGLSLIIAGAILKTTYIIVKIKSGTYKPGKELFLLVAGLLIFFTGLYLRNVYAPPIKPIYLIVLGISLKISFIIGFILKVRSNKQLDS